jgi:hypothetical protein
MKMKEIFHSSSLPSVRQASARRKELDIAIVEDFLFLESAKNSREFFE